MNTFVYVYILQGELNQDHFYIRRTNDLRDRLRRHNTGEVPHTKKWKSWRIKTYVGFSDEQRAIAFEHYLKSASGRAFAKKRF